MDDFLSLGPELVARLRDRLPPGTHVLSAADLAGVNEERQLVPAVHVVYQAYREVESSASGLSSRIQQTWLAVVVTRNVRGLASGAAPQLEAGRLAAGVLQALMGFKPASGAKPLQLTSAPAARYVAGAQYLPLAFVTERVAKVIPS